MITKEQYGEIMYVKGKIESAKNFIKMGVLTIEQIAQGLGLTKEDVLEAKNTIDEQESDENDE